MMEDHLGRHVFQEHALADDDEVGDRVGLGQLLQPVGHILNRCCVPGE